MSELAQSVSQLGELIPTVPDQLGELITSARTVDERTDALADELTRAHELLEQHGGKLQEQLGRLTEASAHAQEVVAQGLAQLEAAANAAREASDGWSDGALREAAAGLDGALDTARDHLATGAQHMEEAREVVDGDIGGLRAQAEAVGASVQKAVDAVVTGLGEISAAVDAAEAGLTADAERINDALDELVTAMSSEAASLLEAAVASRDEAVAEIQEAASTLDGMRSEATAEVDQQVTDMSRTLSEAISRLHAAVDTVNATLSQAAAGIRPVREEYERLSEALGWSEQPLNTMIGEVRKAADQAGIPFA